MYNFALSQGAQKLLVKVKMCSLFYYRNYTFKIWWLITFEPLEINQSYIPHLKVLVCGIDAFSPQWCGSIFTWCYTHLKLALLLHKTATAKYILHSAVGSMGVY